MITKTQIRPMTIVGVVLVSGAILFSARLVYEQTFLTWNYGLQMVGFSLFHSGLGLLGVLFVVLTIIWALILLGLAVARRSLGNRIDIVLLGLFAVSLAALFVSYGQWKLLMVRICGTARVTNEWVTYAAASGETQLLEYLLFHGFDVNSRNRDGQSALGAAAVGGQTKIARMLILRGAHLNNRTFSLGETPLTQAAQMNRTEMVKLLLEHGADPAEKENDGRTALDWARKNNNIEMIALLQARLTK